MSDSDTLSISDIKPKMQFIGTVKRLELAGAVIDIGLETDGLLHISQIPGRVNNVSDHLEDNQEITVWVRSVDPRSGTIKLTMIEPAAVTWEELAEGQTYSGKVVRIEKFGVFIDIGAERPGLVHISEMSDDYINTPRDVVQKGDAVQVKVIGVNRRKNQIDLSMKALAPLSAPAKDEEDEEEQLPTAMAVALQRAMASTASEDEQSSSKKGAEKGAHNQNDILKRTLEQHNNRQ